MVVRCGGGFQSEEPTVKWFREALVAMPQLDRLSFMQLVTGVPILAPDTTITLKLSGEKEHDVFFHSCTSTLDFPRCATKEDLRRILASSMKAAQKAGFSEKTS